MRRRGLRPVVELRELSQRASPRVGRTRFVERATTAQLVATGQVVTSSEFMSQHLLGREAHTLGVLGRASILRDRLVVPALQPRPSAGIR